ncbi:MAG: exodeoxyribonuclease VII large subunit [Lachnospiraceae bacterium]|nr:exodeoxyribonuclease VII large subunit [Lachnospiraceae bacterium]
MKNVYTVTQINAYIKRMFSEDYALNNIMIKGEISNCKYHSSGHIYFTLKDAGAVMSGVMFLGDRGGLKCQLKEGMNVIVSGRINIYERDGKYQIYAKEITPEGEGDLYKKFEQLKKELEEMGMFAAEYKKPIPKFATKIGVVTAATGAAIQDICNISARRNPYVQLYLYSAKVQGEGAGASVASGIRALDAMNLDVLIVGRGGGSIEDLWAFNEEVVARAIFECNTPVISAVGHETDTTIADYVSDLRAPTPSAAAELAVFDVYDFLQGLDACADKLQRNVEGRYNYYTKLYETYLLRLEKKSPDMVIKNKYQDLEYKKELLFRKVRSRYESKEREFLVLAERLNGLSPLNKLKGGYGYVSDDTGKPMLSVKNVKKGDSLSIRLKDGTVMTKAEEIIYTE